MGMHDAILHGEELHPCQHLLQTERTMESKWNPEILQGEKIQPVHTEIKNEACMVCMCLHT